MSHFYAYLSRMRLIRRWGLMRNTYQENIQEHSLQVAIIAQGLAIIKNRFFSGHVNPERVMALAAYHEVAEVFTGDLPTPIKYFNPEMKKVYDGIEEAAKQNLLNMLPAELAEDYRPLLFAQDSDYESWQLVKAADKICAYLKCLEELKAGNQEFAKAEKTIRAEIEKSGLPEVAYFMAKFAPSFTLSLDEMK